MTVTEELENRCQALSAPIINRMARSIIRRMNRDLADQIQDDFARIGMSFFDQMSLKHRDTDYVDFFFGFENLLDRMVREEVAALDDQERLALDFRDLSILDQTERDNTLTKNVKARFGALLDEHLQTVKMQRYIEKYHLNL